MTASAVTRPVGATNQDSRLTQEIPVGVSRWLLDHRELRLWQMGSRLRLVASMTVRSLVLIAVAILLILVLLPAALNAQLPSAG